MSISRNASYNLIGAAAPVVIGLLMVPLYLRLIGADRYGVLAIAFMLLGYFGLFDLGLGRATTYRISALTNAEPDARAHVFKTSIAVNLVMGLIGSAVLYAAAGWFFANVFKVDPALRPEMMASVPLLAVTVPIATLMGTMIGALQARDQFLLANKISILSTFLFQALPLATAWLVGPYLPYLLAAVLVARLITLSALWISCQRLLLRGIAARFQRSEAKLLLGFGGWVTLDALFAPFLVMLDRFLIGAMLGATAVTIYTLPFQVAQRIGVIPAALVSAVFPRLPAAEPEELNQLMAKATRVLLVAISPPVLVGIFAIFPLFDLWVGPKLGAVAAPVGVPVVLGFWINAFAYIPFSALQATRNPDKVAKLHLVETPIYVALLWFGVREYGLMGCACVLAIRSAADYVLLSLLSRGRVADAGLTSALSAIMLLGGLATYLFNYREPLWWVSLVVLGAAISAICWAATPADLRERVTGLLRSRLTSRQA